ncbi:hypothetical protein E2986_08089 [Frieseomelitta varia]|uniref:Dimethyladenosine transferase 2, mitochondrial n=3 Tax=Frieseomelitta varia TaxID=561572 RepID=A0A833RXL1_9HYME|nr:hypothetical protein E2986_08089 [Frieseomelitta varia]
MHLPESIRNIKHLGVKKINKNKISPALSKYLENINPTFRKKIIKDYTSLNLKHINPYLINNEISNEFAALIKDDLLENMSYIIELNPGYGLLTRKLLEANVPFIHLYECRTEFYLELQRLEKIFPDRFSISDTDLQNISRMLNLKATSHVFNNPNKYICELFTNVPKRNWEEKSCMQIIGIVIRFSFIRHLILSVIFQTGFMMHGRAIFYLALSPTIWNKLMHHSKKGLITHIMFRTLFNYTVFGTLDRKGFLPWQNIKKSNITENQFFYVVKLEPKPNLLSLFGEKEGVIYFWHFIRQYYHRPTLRLIPSLEKIIPGFGMRLIEKNYNIFTEFGELNTNQIIDIYMELKSWPGFKESAFLPSANIIRKIYDPHVNMQENEVNQL